MTINPTNPSSPSALVAAFFLYLQIVKSSTHRAPPTVTWIRHPRPFYYPIIRLFHGGISYMVAIFNSLVQFVGLLGVFKYIMDQASISAVHHMLAVLHEASQKGKGALTTDADRQKLITDVGNQVWDP